MQTQLIYNCHFLNREILPQQESPLLYLISSDFGVQENKPVWWQLTEFLTAEKQVLFSKEMKLHNFMITQREIGDKTDLDLIRCSEVKVAQSCPTLCDLMDWIVHGILQARIMEWVAFPFSRESSQPRDMTQV